MFKLRSDFRRFWIKEGHIRLKQALNSLTYQKRVFCRLMILVTIPLLAMGVISCMIYIRAESEQNRLTLNVHTEEIAGSYENGLVAVKEYYMEWSKSDSFQWLLRQKEAPYNSYSFLRQAQNGLEGSSLVDGYVEDYEFINSGEGWFLNSHGMFNQENLNNKREIETFLEEQAKNPAAVYWINSSSDPPVVNRLRMINTVDCSGLRLIIKENKNTGIVNWMISVKINETMMRRMLSSYEEMGYDVSILNGDMVFLETNSDLTKTFLENRDRGTGEYKSQEGKTYRMNWRNGTVSGLTYVIGFDTGRIQKNAAAFILAALAVIAGFGLIMLLVRMTAAALATPMQRLERYVSDQNQQIKELLMSNMIKGDLTEERANQALNNANIDRFFAYRMVALTVKCHDTAEKAASEGIRSQYMTILDQLPNHIREKIFVAPVYYREKLIFIVGADSDGETDSKIALLYKEVKDFIETRFCLAIATGISRVFHQLHHVHRAYEECSEALYDPINQGDTEEASLALFDDYLMIKQETNVYDIIVENELLQAIEKGDKENGRYLLKLILDRMEAKDVIGIERTFYLMRLLTSIVNIPSAAGIPLSAIFSGEQYNILSHIMGIYNKNQLIKEIWDKVISPVITRLEKEKEGENDREVIKRIQMLVKEKKGNISLNECAEILNYHPNYLSKVLKQDKGITFTEMIAQEKLVQAKYMLLTTEYSIAEISEKLQYTNVQNFIRFFKKHVEVTPAAFRKEHKK